MKVLMLPHLSQRGKEESGIIRVIENYFKYLPQFGVGLVNPDVGEYDIKAVHAGMTGGDCEVALLHGLYWTSDFATSTTWEYQAKLW